jgi:aminoglycoside phosphotransferase (APT) family kinase protein
VIATRAAAGPFETTAIVHYDLNPGNVLVAGDEVTGVIDWDAACHGDRAFDLATVLFYCYGEPRLRDMLWSAVLELVQPRIAAGYLSHLILREVDWSLRNRAGADVSHWLGIARAVLAGLHTP